MLGLLVSGDIRDTEYNFGYKPFWLQTKYLQPEPINKENFKRMSSPLSTNGFPCKINTR
jgi:hypothetical protein